MIGKLVGLFSGYYGNTILLDLYSNNTCIGFEILMKQNDILSLKIGEVYTIFIKEIITEDNDVFYGFLSFEDKCWFEEMIKISGLGPKTALNILSNYSCETITEAIMMNNCDFFSSISGIGNKIANRIPTEMNKQIAKINEKVLSFNDNDNINKNKHEQILCNDNTNTTKSDILYQDIATSKNIKEQQKCKTINKKKDTKTAQNINEIVNDAVKALITLGFSKQKIYNEVYNVVKNNNNITTEKVIKEFLKKLDK